MDRILSVEYCGDNIKNGTEECDGTDGVSTGQACSSTCTLEYCGNGKKEGPEECDGTDGVSTGQTCHATKCKLEYCGDGIKNGTEECDGTDTTAGQTCASDCTLVATTDTTTATDDIQAQLREPSIELTDTTTDTTTAAGTCGDGTIDQSQGEECDGTSGITDSTAQECSSECKIVTKTSSFCTDGATPVTVFCYGTETAADGTNSGYCLNSAGDPAVEIKNFAAPKNFMPGLKALLFQDKNRIFRTDLASGTVKRIQSSYSFTQITDLALGSSALYVVDSGKVLKATTDGVSDLGLSVTVERLAFDSDGNKYLLTDDGKLYKADTSDALTEIYDIKAERADFKAGGKMALFKGSLYLSDLTAGMVLQYNITTGALSELAEVTAPTGLAVRRSTGDLMVQNLEGSVIYKIALAEAAAGQTLPPEVYMEKVKSTGMAEVKICPSVTIIEHPTADTTATSEATDTTGTSEATDTAAAGETTETVDTADDEGEGAAEVEGETVAAVTDSAAEAGDTADEEDTEGEATLTADDTTTSSGDSGFSEGEDEGGGGGGVKMVGGCLNMAGSAPTPASTASLVWLLLNFGAMIGTRIKKKRAGRLDRSAPPS